MEVKQTSNQVSDTKWSWSMWLEGSKEELDEVKQVIYHLHPTFPNPIVKRTDRNKKFRLKASGWGTFVVKVIIEKNNGSTETVLHRLRFSRTDPKVYVSAASHDEAAIDEVKNALRSISVGVLSGRDVGCGEDLLSTIQEQIDKSKALILINGKTPSRWVMRELNTAKSLGKPIISVGENRFYDTMGTMQTMHVDSMEQLTDMLSKLSE